MPWGLIFIIGFGIAAYLFFSAAYPIPTPKDGGHYEI